MFLACHHRDQCRGAGAVDRGARVQRGRRACRAAGRLGELAKKLRDRYRLGCEVVYVDDGSSDGTLGIARGLAADTARCSGGVAVAPISARRPR